MSALVRAQGLYQVHALRLVSCAALSPALDRQTSTRPNAALVVSTAGDLAVNVGIESWNASSRGGSIPRRFGGQGDDLFIAFGSPVRERRGIWEESASRGSNCMPACYWGGPEYAPEYRPSMAIADRSLSALVAPHVEAAKVAARAAPPQLLRCLVVSLSAERRRLIRTAAEAQAWDAIACRDAGEFLRVVFKRAVPLLIVDLPDEASPDYWELRRAAGLAKDACQSLLFVTGVMADSGEELWARGMGAWAYLSELYSQRGFEAVFSDARDATSRRSSWLDSAPYERLPLSEE